MESNLQKMIKDSMLICFSKTLWVILEIRYSFRPVFFFFFFFFQILTFNWILTKLFQEGFNEALFFCCVHDRKIFSNALTVRSCLRPFVLRGNQEKASCLETRPAILTPICSYKWHHQLPTESCDVTMWQPRRILAHHTIHRRSVGTDFYRYNDFLNYSFNFKKLRIRLNSPF